jgi:hypothetical protein
VVDSSPGDPRRGDLISRRPVLTDNTGELIEVEGASPALRDFPPFKE